MTILSENDFFDLVRRESLKLSGKVCDEVDYDESLNVGDVG